MTTKKKRLRLLVKSPKGGRFTAKQVRDALKALEKKLTLSVGDKIYIETSWYIDHGEDDVQGGLATVSAVRVEKYGTFVEVKEVPGSGYNLDVLM